MKFASFAFGLSFIGLSNIAASFPIEVSPIADGSVSSFGIVHDQSHNSTSSISRVVVEFDLGFQIDSSHRVLFSMNPWSLPLHGNPFDVFGFTGADGSITAADYDAGTLLGNWNFPDDILYGEEDFFDVTDFVLLAQDSAFGFVLHGSNISSFSSLEVNLGSGPKLIVSEVPEPNITYLFLSMLVILALRKQACQPRCGPQSCTGASKRLFVPNPGGEILRHGC